MSGGHRSMWRDRGPAPGLRIREALAAERLFVIRLSAQAFRPFGAYAGVIGGWFDSGEAWTQVAILGGRLVAFSMCARIPPTLGPPRGTELLAIAVAREARRCGVGRRLLRRTQVVVRENGADTLWLHTAVENLPARCLFEEEGFRLVELKHGFYPRGQDAVLMVKALPGAVPPG